MAFEPPNKKEIISAIGSKNDLPGFNFEQNWVTRRLKKNQDSNYGQD